MEVEKSDNKLVLTIEVPLEMSGDYTYGEGIWTAPAVCVRIDDHLGDYGLFHTQYLDYKDSLQATAPIAYFDSKKEALEVAERFNLSVEYAYTPTT